MSGNAPTSASRAPLKTSRVIPLLLVCALGAITFTCAGGYAVYSNTQRLVESRNWLDHSYTVLTNLQMMTQRLDRISYGMRLYAATGDAAEQRAVESAAANMQAGILSLKNLVRDNPSQSSQVQKLDGKLQELSRILEDQPQLRVVPERQIQECRTVLSVIQQEERTLLVERSNESQNSKTRSFLSGAGFLGFSLIVVIVLFIFLVRDALRRRSYETQLSITNEQLEATIEELERHGGEASLLKGARDELQLCVNSEEAQACAARHFHGIVPGSSGATLVINNSRSLLEVAATWNNPSQLADPITMDACCGLRSGRPRWRRPGESELHCNHFVGVPPENYVCIPLAAQGETLGFVYMSCPTDQIADLAQNRMPLVQEMVELASMAIAGLNLRAKLESQSIRDGLTNLFNRHFMEIALERELHRAIRRNATLAVLMLDVDHFKTFNDTFGHEAGDIVLRTVAEHIQHSVRSEDIVCRYGGEEFVIILPEITQELAIERADSIRRGITDLRIRFREEALRPVSISIGLAMFPDPARDSSDLLRMSDMALYEAKRTGRDRIVVAHGTVQQSSALLDDLHQSASSLI